MYSVQYRMPWYNHPTIVTKCWPCLTPSTLFLHCLLPFLSSIFPHTCPVLPCTSLSCNVRGCVPAGHVHTGVPLDRRGIHRRREGQGTHLRQQVHQRGTHIHTYHIPIKLPVILIIHVSFSSSIYLSINLAFQSSILFLTHSFLMHGTYITIPITTVLHSYLTSPLLLQSLLFSTLVYQAGDGRDVSCPVITVPSGSEPTMFTAHFRVRYVTLLHVILHNVMSCYVSILTSIWLDSY